MCRPKHVEQLRNIGIINSTTPSHLVGPFYEIYITMHGSVNIKYSVLFEHRIILDFHFNFSIRDICSALTKSNISPLCRSTMNLEGRCRQLTNQEPRLYCTQHDEETRPTAVGEGGKNEAIVTSGIREETDIHYGAIWSKQLRARLQNGS
jgi:hypothetical protein